MAGFGTQYGVTRYGWEDEEAGTGNILLLVRPTSPNSRLTTDPMFWRLGDSFHTANVQNLVVGGISAVINNVVQTGFTGTCTPNAYGGQDVSIVADADYWEPEYSIDWVLHAEDGFEDKYFYGTIVKFVTLPYPPPPPEDPEVRLCRAFAFPMRFTGDGNMVLNHDDQSKKDNLRNAVMILKRGIPFLEAGTMASMESFESDPSTGPRIGQETQESLAVLDPDVVVAPVPLISEQDKQITCRFAYSIVPGDPSWKTASVPVYKVDG